MAIIVEPIDGAELDRLITSLLNATGAVHQLIEEELATGNGDGLEIIDLVATRLRAILSVIAEHHGDDELRVITEFLAVATMLVAEEEGFADAFRMVEPDDPEADPPMHADWV